jgi:hypothetical protein
MILTENKYDSGLACLSALARSVLESVKLCKAAMAHAKTIAASSYSPPATAYLQRHDAMVELINGLFFFFFYYL